MTLKQFEQASFIAFKKAIEAVGMDAFKATSLFGSNEK